MGTFKSGQVLTDAILNARDITGTLVYSAAKAGTQSVSSATFTAVIFDAPTVDTLGVYSAGTPTRFTPNVAGNYVINGGIAITASTAGRRIIAVYKNGTRISINEFFPSNTGGEARIPLPVTTTYLNGSTDYIEAIIYQNSGGSLTTVANEVYLFVTYAGA